MRAYGLFLLLFALACSQHATPDVTSAHVPADSTCAFVLRAAHPEPIRLVREFVERDARGEFTRSSNWFDGAVDCPGHEAAPDQATMARAHQIRVFARGRDSVRAEVRWQRIGYFGHGGDAVAPGVEVDTLTVLRTPYGWRIASPALNPHMPVPPPPRP